MSRFTPLVQKEYTFEADKITVLFSRLKRKHVMKLLPHIATLGEKSSEKSAVLNEMLDVIPEYITSLQGLVDSQGIAVTSDTVFEEVYFMELAMAITMDVIAESMPMMGEAGKNA